MKKPNTLVVPKQRPTTSKISKNGGSFIGGDKGAPVTPAISKTGGSFLGSGTKAPPMTARKPVSKPMVTKPGITKPSVVRKSLVKPGAALMNLKTPSGKISYSKGLSKPTAVKKVVSNVPPKAAQSALLFYFKRCGAPWPKA